MSFHFENDRISSIQFNGKIINMMFPTKFPAIFTLRYLTLSVGYSLLPRNFTFKSSSNFFCLDLKITISAFLH